MSLPDGKKLYAVTVEVTYYALASSEREACGYADDAINDTSFIEDSAYANQVKHARECIYDGGWEPDSLVYGADGDLTLEAAFDAVKETAASGGTK